MWGGDKVLCINNSVVCGVVVGGDGMMCACVCGEVMADRELARLRDRSVSMIFFCQWFPRLRGQRPSLTSRGRTLGVSFQPGFICANGHR